MILCRELRADKIICCSLLTEYTVSSQARRFKNSPSLDFLSALLTCSLIPSCGFHNLVAWEQKKEPKEYSDALMILSSALGPAQLLSAAFAYLKSAPLYKYPVVSLQIATSPGIFQIVSTANFIDR